RNTTVSNIQSDVFFFKASVSGTAYTDANHDGHFNPGEPLAKNLTVKLIDTDGNVVASAQTDPMGHYQFNAQEGLGTGTYFVEAFAPNGDMLSKTPALNITKGDTNLTGVDLAVPPPQGNSTPLPPPKSGNPAPPPPKSGSQTQQSGPVNLPP